MESWGLEIDKMLKDGPYTLDAAFHAANNEIWNEKQVVCPLELFVLALLDAVPGYVDRDSHDLSKTFLQRIIRTIEKKLDRLTTSSRRGM